MNSAPTGSHTTNKKPQYIPTGLAGKAYVQAYVGRIRAIRDAFQHQKPGSIWKPQGFNVEDTQYFWEYKRLYDYGGFKWHSAFSHIKPKLLTSSAMKKEA